MKRRDFIAATAALLVSPRPLRAQGTPRRIGFLCWWADEPARDPAHAAWLSGLREKGWIEGKNLLVEYRFAPDRLPALAAELVALTPELIICSGPQTALALKSATATTGCWSSSRVLSDHSGLGRLVTKALLFESDLQEKPQCDISYDEISRWLNGVTASKLPLRGMAARSLSIEISLGVTCPFATGRVEPARSEASAAAQRREDQAQAFSESQRSKVSSNQVAFLSRSLDILTTRIEQIERYVSNDLEMKRKIAAESPQRDLLGGLKTEPETPKPSKKR